MCVWGVKSEDIRYGLKIKGDSLAKQKLPEDATQQQTVFYGPLFTARIEFLQGKGTAVLILKSNQDPLLLLASYIIGQLSYTDLLILYFHKNICFQMKTMSSIQSTVCPFHRSLQINTMEVSNGTSLRQAEVAGSIKGSKLFVCIMRELKHGSSTQSDFKDAAKILIQVSLQNIEVFRFSGFFSEMLPMLQVFSINAFCDDLSLHRDSDTVHRKNVGAFYTQNYINTIFQQRFLNALEYNSNI